jgi:tRNA pseudouridine38-40 synthase
MPRYKLILEYDGGPFVGWQRQENGSSIQGALEDAVKAFCGESVRAFAAGRTDAGVHARAMTAHIDLDASHRAEVVANALNAYLRPAPIAVLSAEEVSKDFHARFSARGRSYEYLIANRRAPLALDAGRLWRVSDTLDVDAMHAAAQSILGRHDFTTFRAVKCQAASPEKTLTRLDVRRMGETVVIAAAAPSFLHHQVRSLAGSLVEVGRGKWRPRDMRAALDARDRAACGPVAPAQGLYFLQAVYDDQL